MSHLHRARGTEISAADLYEVLRLRAEVFVVEQACVYLDPDGRDLEPNTTHLWLTDTGSDVVAYLRVLEEPDGTTRIGRVVTGLRHRGHRRAGQLLDGVLENITGNVVLDAQSQLVDVYARHGFQVDGDEYVDDGIPHTPMRRPARQPKQS